MKKLVYIGATWCGPCKLLKPVLAELEDVEVEMLILDEGSAEEKEIKEEIALNLGVKSIPFLAYFLNGKQICTSLGVLSKEQIMSNFVTNNVKKS